MVSLSSFNALYLHTENNQMCLDTYAQQISYSEKAYNTIHFSYILNQQKESNHIFIPSVTFLQWCIFGCLHIMHMIISMTDYTLKL